MSTAVAHPPPGPTLDRNPSPRNYPTLAPSPAAPSVERMSDLQEVGHMSNQRTPPDGGRISPNSIRSGANPQIIVKKEPPSSPSIQPGSRHRPKKLDLNTNTSSMSRPNGSRPSATPLTARDSLNTLQDVGLACLSPGFQTHDPTMREQLQRSLSVRDQQRNIIEQRLLKSAKGDPADPSMDSMDLAGKGPATLSKKRPPPGLSIVPPAAERFANERVVQSAPLNQTFTGRSDPNPHARQPYAPSALAQTSNIQHIPAMQTSNKLPPISDVFGANELHPANGRPAFLHTNSTPGHHGPPMPSPSYPPQTAHPMSQPAHTGWERPRDYRSAEEAVQEMTGGREELMPKIVHYGGHQPPTPPSPHPQQGHENLTPHKYHPGFGAGRRRSRNEYEAGSSPPLGTGRDRRYGPFGEGRDSPATQRAKKDEFLSLCDRAWDLFHS